MKSTHLPACSAQVLVLVLVLVLMPIPLAPAPVPVCRPRLVEHST